MRGGRNGCGHETSLVVVLIDLAGTKARSHDRGIFIHACKKDTNQEQMPRCLKRERAGSGSADSSM
jgi:hypothetical protein